MTVDTERGMVFIPTGNPGGSFYGGDRPGDNLCATSVVALDAATGAYKWHFQTTHHDVFDADLAAAPALIDVVRDGRAHSGRGAGDEDGRHGVHPRSPHRQADLTASRSARCPISKVPGEVSAPTQPFPTRPAPWSRLGMTRADITTVTPESNKFCTEWWDKERMYNDGPYTPYGADGVTVVFSGTIGGGNWGGAAFNPQLGYLFVNTSSLATIGHMVPGSGAREIPQRAVMHAVLGRQQVSVPAAALGESRRGERQHRRRSRGRSRSGSIRSWSPKVFRRPARRISAARSPRRAGSCSSAPPRMRGSAPTTPRPARSLWYAQLEAAGARHADDLHGPQRHAVCRHRRGRTG